MSQDTITREKLDTLLRNEGINPIFVEQPMVPCWDETQPKGVGVHSALLTSDLIVRSDGSYVYLDGEVSMDATMLARIHHGVENVDDVRERLLDIFPELKKSTVATNELCPVARDILGWKEYVNRLSEIPNGGVL